MGKAEKYREIVKISEGKRIFAINV